MSEHGGEKTELPTQRRMEDAAKRGQIPRSAEVQTAFVLMTGLGTLIFTGHELWQTLVSIVVNSLGHLHDTPLSENMLQAYTLTGAMAYGKAVGPILLATMLAGLLAGTIQNRFQTASEALNPDWNRLNPVSGFKRLFSTNAAMSTVISLIKLAMILVLSYSEIRKILNDPIFAAAVGVSRIAEFLAQSFVAIFLRIGLVLGVIAAADYGYQWWKNHNDLMMTKEELKEEMKNSEGNPLIKSARRRMYAMSKLRMQVEVPKADVVVTNPTHFAVALRYDRKTMKAPKIVAKGIRLNAQKIKEIARQHQIPIIENKPLARLLFKHGKVGGEVPAQLYMAVAEVLAWVYRVNRYRYYAEENKA